MVDSNTFEIEYLSLKEDIIKISKRAIKKKTPKSSTSRDDIKNSLIKNFNLFSRRVYSNWSILSLEQRNECKKYFLCIRDKTLLAFQYLQIDYKIPRALGEVISSDSVDENFTYLEEDPIIKTEMALSLIDFFNLASKIFSNEYSGDPEKLQCVIDALYLLQANVGEYNVQAVAYIKTKLIGKARQCTEKCTTIPEIITALHANISREKSSVIAEKLLNNKQKSKDQIAFIYEIEALTTKLQLAYVSEGVPSEVADKYTCDTVVKALAKNASSEKVKLAMEVGTFSSARDALDKFAMMKHDEPTSSIFHMRGNSYYVQRGGQMSRGYRPQNFGRYNSTDYIRFPNNSYRPNYYNSRNPTRFPNNSYRPNYNNSTGFTRFANDGYRPEYANNSVAERGRSNNFHSRGYQGNFNRESTNDNRRNVRLFNSDIPTNTDSGSENRPNPQSNDWGQNQQNQ